MCWHHWDSVIRFLPKVTFMTGFWFLSFTLITSGSRLMTFRQRLLTIFLIKYSLESIPDFFMVKPIIRFDGVWCYDQWKRGLWNMSTKAGSQYYKIDWMGGEVRING